MANQEQLGRLLQGVEGWNQWRQENPGIGTDLSYVYLHRANLQGANLRSASLSGADLNEADLQGADLQGANLHSASLSGANLNEANLQDADLSGTNLKGANLEDADLSGADLSGAKLICANLSGADLRGAILTNANLLSADLSGANLFYANLSGTNLKGANLEDADLSGADLSGADLCYAILSGADLSGANLEGAILSETVPRGIISQPAPPDVVAYGFDMEDAMLEGAEGVNNEFTDTDGNEFTDAARYRVTQGPKRSYVEKACDNLDALREAMGGLKAFCCVHAEMDNQVVVNRPTSVEVLVSKEQLEQAISQASQTGIVELNAEQRLLVQVIPKTNFVSEGDDRFEVDPPQAGKSHTLYFDLRATHLGEGEVWVVLRQTQQALLTLILRPQIVANRAALRLSRSAQLPAAADSNEALGAQRIRATKSVTDGPNPSTPLHQLRIIERRNGSQITYLYELNSPLLGVLSLHESKPIHSDRLEYVENLYKEIESRWASTQGDKDDFAAELRAFGGQLFDQLFPDALKQQLWEYRSQLDNIMVLSTEPFIPWELVHLKPPGQNYLPDEPYFLGQMGLVRWLHDVGFPPETLQIRSGKARYVIPQYPDPRYRLPQAEQEAQFLEQHFEATKVEAQPTPVRQELRRSTFDLLHFAGHGLADQNNMTHAKLMLEGRVEYGQYVTAQLSATTVEQYCNCSGRARTNRPMVVLNACQIGREGYCLTGISGFAQAFLKGGVGVFVGTLWSVGDRPARLFTETLYSSLLEGHTLSESTTAARQAAQQAGDSTWLAYVVYGHPHLKLRAVNEQGA